MSLTRNDLDKIAVLARLSLKEEEAAKLVFQLESILNYVAKLNELDTSRVEPLAHALPIQNVVREDAVTNSAPHPLILQNAPKASQNWFSVPKVIE